MGEISWSQSAGQNGLTYEARSKDYPGLTTATALEPDCSLGLVALSHLQSKLSMLSRVVWQQFLQQGHKDNLHE